jgi:hypothetical protein
VALMVALCIGKLCNFMRPLANGESCKSNGMNHVASLCEAVRTGGNGLSIRRSHTCATAVPLLVPLFDVTYNLEIAV